MIKNRTFHLHNGEKLVPGEVYEHCSFYGPALLYGDRACIHNCTMERTSGFGLSSVPPACRAVRIINFAGITAYNCQFFDISHVCGSALKNPFDNQESDSWEYRARKKWLNRYDH